MRQLPDHPEISMRAHVVEPALQYGSAVCGRQDAGAEPYVLSDYRDLRWGQRGDSKEESQPESDSGRGSGDRWAVARYLVHPGIPLSKSRQAGRPEVAVH